MEYEFFCTKILAFPIGESVNFEIELAQNRDIYLPEEAHDIDNIIIKCSNEIPYQVGKKYVVQIQESA